MSFPHNHAIQTSLGICYRRWWLQNQSAIVFQQIRFNNLPASGLQTNSELKRKEKKRHLLAGHFVSTGCHPARPIHREVETSKVSTHGRFQKGEAGGSRPSGAEQQGRAVRAASGSSSGVVWPIVKNPPGSQQAAQRFEMQRSLRLAMYKVGHGFLHSRKALAGPGSLPRSLFSGGRASLPRNLGSSQP